MNRCNNCNSSVKKRDLFCKTCGAKLEKSRVKEMFLMLILLGIIFVIIWLAWVAIAKLNLSWLYNGFQYPSILIALVTIFYGFIYALNEQSEIDDQSDDMVFFRWIAKKGKKYGKLEDVIISRVDGNIIGLGIYEASRKNESFYKNKSFELDNLEIPEYLIGLITFLKDEKIIDSESLNNSLKNRFKIPTSRYVGKYDKEVNAFISGLTRELQYKTIINPHIKKAQYLVRSVAILLLIFGFASFVRMEVGAVIVMTYVLEGIILLFLSRYIFGLGRSGKLVKDDVKKCRRLLKDPMSLIMEMNNFSDALAVVIAFDKKNKFIRKVNKFTDEEYLALNISVEDVQESIDEMMFYLSVGEILYSNSKVGEKSSYIEYGEQIE